MNMKLGSFAPSSGAARRVGLLAIVLAAAFLLVAGCGSSDQSSTEEGQQEEEATPATPVEIVQVAYRKTAEAQTAKMDMTVDMNMSEAQGGKAKGGGMSMNMGGQGEIDLENQRANFVMQMPMGMGEMEMRQIGTTAYMRMPEAMRAQAPDGRPWIRMDLDEMMQEQYGASFSQMQGGAQNDPTRQLEFLQDISDSVEEIGEEEIRGEPATHYRAVVDLQKAAEAKDLPEEARQAHEQQAQQMIEQLGTSEIPVDVWIDGEGRVRRYEMNMPLPTPPQGGQQGAPKQGPEQDVEGEMTMAYELYDFGTPVEVEEPPADQVVSMEEFMAAAQQQQNAKGKQKV